MITCRISVKRSQGFTLIELIAVILIILIILSILIPSIMSAREAMRKAGCAANLRQVGLAMTNYDTAIGSLPLASNGNRGFSPHSMVLPYMDQTVLYNSINFSVGPLDQPNETAGSTRLSTLICPANGNADFKSSLTNYACSVGYGYQLPADTDGIFGLRPLRAMQVTRAGSVPDGTAYTVLASEWVTGSNQKNKSIDKSNVYYTSSEMLLPGDFEKFNSLCSSIYNGNDIVSVWNFKGLRWIGTDMGNSLYNHNIAPNKNSCLNGSSTLEGSWTASSNHYAGVSALFADGHVQFIRDTISTAAWRALSTKSGGEAVQLSE